MLLSRLGWVAFSQMLNPAASFASTTPSGHCAISSVNDVMTTGAIVGILIRSTILFDVAEEKDPGNVLVQ